MIGDKINFIINSKNRDREINPSASVLDVVIPSGLLFLQQDEVFYLNVNGFYCFKNFYNCQLGYNSCFELIYTDINNVKTTTTYNLMEGNFDVYQLRDYLNGILSNDLLVQYDEIKNKFSYTRISPIDDNHQLLQLNIINADAFLGFSIDVRNIPITILYNTTIYSSQPINVNGDSSLIIEMTGDVVVNSSLDNLNNTQLLHSKVIFMKTIDVPPTGLLKYDNIDGGDSFCFKLSNQEQITWFKINVYNQDYQLITNLTDYILHLQFIKQKKGNMTEMLLGKILEYLRDFFMLISNQIFRL